MKRIFFAAALALAAIPIFAADVGVSISVGEPGFYGRIDIGDYPRPRVIYRRAMAVERVPVGREPIYLRVPPEHARHWRRHCYRYDACGERVYFVQNSWYNREYVPRYRERHGDRRDEHGDGRRDHRRYDRRDDRGGEQHWDPRNDRHDNDRYPNR